MWKTVDKGKTCLNKIRFLDSFGFFPKALSQLIQVQKIDNFDSFPLIKQRFSDDEIYYLLTCKGIYAYDYYNSASRLDEVLLPPIEAFYNSLTESECTTSDYGFGQRADVKMGGIIVNFTWPVMY